MPRLLCSILPVFGSVSSYFYRSLLQYTSSPLCIGGEFIHMPYGDEYHNKGASHGYSENRETIIIEIRSLFTGKL